jgi:hypothetical protein
MATATIAFLDDIIAPVSRELLISELQYAQLLGKTKDNIGVYTTKTKHTPNILTEISRLREITFRAVGEGTGKSHDFDFFDNYYTHLFLWDYTNNEIIGSYRLGFLKELLSDYSEEYVYTATLCKLSSEFFPLLVQSIELGRSFIQQKYWNTNALDYLWQGLGKIVKENENIRYLWGPVSISNSYPDDLKKMLIFYYRKWYQSDAHFIKCVTPFEISEVDSERYNTIFNSGNISDDYLILKKHLHSHALSVPVLVRKYTELTEYPGTRILGFNIDPEFADCVDALILVDLSKLKETYRLRYYNQKSFIKN